MRQTGRRVIDHSTIAKDDYILFLGFWAYLGALVVYFANLKLAGCMRLLPGRMVIPILRIVLEAKKSK